MGKLKVIYKKVGKDPEVLEIEPKLEEYRKLVDGQIEVVYLDYLEGEDLGEYLLICNKEGKVCEMDENYDSGDFFIAKDGKLYKMDANIEIPYDCISGDFFIVKHAGEDFESVKGEDIEKIVGFINSHRLDL